MSGQIIHTALSVDVDRFGDAYLRKRVCAGITIDGRTPTVAELRAACAEARAAGLECFPPCDNVDDKGRCKGHRDEHFAGVGMADHPPEIGGSS